MSEKDEAAAPEETLVPRSPEEGEADSFRPFDEFAEGYQPTAIPRTTGPDGLPQHVDPGYRGEDIPPLSTENLVCMGDFSSFVQRDSFGRVRLKTEPEKVQQMPDGKWYRNAGTDEEPFLEEVEPIRPPCVHYARQVTQLEKNPEHRLHARLCTARRTTSGAFMDLGDLAMWACSMRSPRDLDSEKTIKEFDDAKIEQGANRAFHSIFSNK